jgi:hypothetical protein
VQHGKLRAMGVYVSQLMRNLIFRLLQELAVSSKQCEEDSEKVPRKRSSSGQT